MDTDTIIYTIILSSSLLFGYVYRQIKDKHCKKWVGTCTGLLIVLFASTYQIWYPILLFVANAGIILLSPKSHCHLMSFFFSFSYLLFFRLRVTDFGILNLPVHANVMLMTLTLKLVGLAFEVHDEAKRNMEQTTHGDNNNNVELNFWDILHYTFNYIGIATGPYYRYKTFVDFFNLPFCDNTPRDKETFIKFLYSWLFYMVYLIGNYIWPLSYAMSDEFYSDRSWLYRFWYSWPTCFNFRMQIYSGLLMTEAVCTMVGFGAYPSITEPKPGQGPSKNFDEIEKIVNSSQRLKNEKYDFRTIYTVYPYQYECLTTSRDSIRTWNICIQYWLLTYIYKRFPNKKLRTAATMLVSAYWHGFYIGYYLSIGIVAFYLPLEDIYVKLFLKNNSGMSLKIWEWIIWLFKMQAFSYLGMSFTLLTFKEVVRYFKSIYCCGFIIGIILYIIGLYTLKLKEQCGTLNAKLKSVKKKLL